MKINLNIKDNGLVTFTNIIRNAVFENGRKEYKYFEISNYQVAQVLQVLADYTKENENINARTRAARTQNRPASN